MIYVSTAKIGNILEKYNKPGVEISVDQMEVKFLGVNSKINIAKRQNNLDKVIKILKKKSYIMMYLNILGLDAITR